MLDETIVIIFAELAKFCKTEDECQTKQDRMLYLLKNSGTLSVPPKWIVQEDYNDFLDACEIEAFDKEKRYNYDKDMYDEKRRKGELAAAIEQGVEQGIAIGFEKGHAEGHAEGVVQVAKNMLTAGLTYDQIVQLTGLDMETIQDLESTMAVAE